MLGNFGNLGRNAVRLNGLTNSDWVFLKDTAVTEAMADRNAAVPAEL